ncbi:hypothetical protein [Arsenicibacter rosenii]|uniref:NADH dehydrogenase n=1 Tax=Arsenicibacter rosenii TaxID=1750698 RepID=A0A1S2VF81_9BACT|nr:hypothetical protein [Arsenicibacter rosenii]OIN57417.1 hypothetical protein BLX24_19490 [Arsenicibacter rosenii]
MFGLDPLSRPVAIIEIVLLLFLAAFVGWVIARLIMNARIKALQGEIADKEASLAECRRAKSPSVTTTVTAPAPSIPAGEAQSPLPVTAKVVSQTIMLPSQKVIGDPSGARSTEIPATKTTPETAKPAVPEPISATPVTPPPTGNSESAILARIALRASELNFDRIGHANPQEADDLKAINGVGPFLERKLHSLGIYTFRQIANFTKEDIRKVNEIIEFFPGRIEGDDWVGQAKAFFEFKTR